MAAEAIPPLPGYDAYFEAAKKIGPSFSLKMGKVSVQAPDQRLATLLRGVGETMEYVARTVEPIDRISERVVDTEFASSYAIANGGLAGALVADKVHNGVGAAELLRVRKRVSDVRKELKARAEGETDDKIDIQHLTAGYIIDYGQRGIELIGSQAEDVLEEIEIKVVTDVSKQRMFRVGAGVVLMAAHELHRDAYFKDQLERVDSLVADVNWDDEITQLLSGGGENRTGEN